MKSIIFVFTLALPVHEFYSESCCTGKDCYPVACEEVTAVPEGWKWHDMTFRKDMLQQAPDGQCHVCVIKEAFWDSAIGPRCIYLPPRM